MEKTLAVTCIVMVSIVALAAAIVSTPASATVVEECFKGERPIQTPGGTHCVPAQSNAPLVVPPSQKYE